MRLGSGPKLSASVASTRSLGQTRAAMKHARNERMMGHDRQGLTQTLLRQAASPAPHGWSQAWSGTPNLNGASVSSANRVIVVRTSSRRNSNHPTRLKLLHETRMIPHRGDPLSAACGRVSGPDCDQNNAGAETEAGHTAIFSEVSKENRNQRHKFPELESQEAHYRQHFPAKRWLTYASKGARNYAARHRRQMFRSRRAAREVGSDVMPLNGHTSTVRGSYSWQLEACPVAKLMPAIDRCAQERRGASTEWTKTSQRLAWTLC